MHTVTFEEIAELCGVTRRAVRYWLKKPQKEHNELCKTRENISRVLQDAVETQENISRDLRDDTKTRENISRVEAIRLEYEDISRKYAENSQLIKVVTIIQEKIQKAYNERKSARFNEAEAMCILQLGNRSAVADLLKQNKEYAEKVANMKELLQNCVKQFLENSNLQENALNLISSVCMEENITKLLPDKTSKLKNKETRARIQKKIALITFLSNPDVVEASAVEKQQAFKTTHHIIRKKAFEMLMISYEEKYLGWGGGPGLSQDHIDFLLHSLSFTDYLEKSDRLDDYEGLVDRVIDEIKSNKIPAA